MKKHASQRGEVFIGFILVASIILVLIYGIIDLARYTTLKSTAQTATMDVVQYAKSEDALLASPYEPAGPEMPKYLRARQSLSRVFNTNPLLQQTHTQLSPVQVAHYGGASGPEVVASIPEYVAYLPPGTSAQFIFPGEATPRWIHHSVCCDPTVEDCPEAQRRTTSTNPCNGVPYEKLLGKYPTEFVSAAVVKNSQIFSSNLVTRSSGFPRVQLVAVVTTTTTPTTTLERICIRVVPPIVTTSCAFNTTTKKFVTTTVSNNRCDPAVSSTTISDPQERCDPRVGIIYYLDNRDDCESVIKTELPRVNNAFDCSIDSTERILTATTNSINPATCALMTATVTRARPRAACAEHDGALWHHTHDRNLLTCDWDINTSNKVQNKPPLFCGINPETNRYEIRNYVPDFDTCTYQLSTEPIATREVQCSIDPLTGEGKETSYTFSEAACQFVVNSTVTKPRPTATCTETTNGVRATFTNYHDFVRDGASCKWRGDVSQVPAPGRTCTERLNPTTNTYEAVKGTRILHVDVGVSPAICNYNATESISHKPADSACAADGDQFSRTTYIFNNNPDSCGYTPTKIPCDKIDCVVSDWTGAVPTTCGQSYTMTRTIVIPPQNGGNACPALTEVRTTEPCIKIDCQVSDWAGTVPTTCGQSYTMTRTVITQPQNDGAECPTLTEVRTTEPCVKIDCQVSDWTGTVPTACEQSYTMTRTITVPPQNGGAACPILTETRNTEPCEREEANVCIPCERVIRSDNSSVDGFLLSGPARVCMTGGAGASRGSGGVVVATFTSVSCPFGVERYENVRGNCSNDLTIPANNSFMDRTHFASTHSPITTTAMGYACQGTVLFDPGQSFAADQQRCIRRLICKEPTPQQLAAQPKDAICTPRAVTPPPPKCSSCHVWYIDPRSRISSAYQNAAHPWVQVNGEWRKLSYDSEAMRGCYIPGDPNILTGPTVRSGTCLPSSVTGLVEITQREEATSRSLTSPSSPRQWIRGPECDCPGTCELPFAP